MKRNIMFSQYMRIKEKNDIVAVFHALNPKPIFFKSKDWSGFVKNKDDQKTIDLLMSLRIIINDKKEDREIFENIRAEYEANNKQVATLYLVLTHQCNFRCKYCFEVNFEDEKGHGKMMDDKTIKKGIDLFASQFKASHSNNDRRCLIILYGGEPLLNKKACYYAVKYIKSLQEKEILPDKKTEIVVITNGSLVNENDAIFFKKNKVAILVSLDSNIGEINNACRIDKYGRGVFDKTIKTIDILKKHNVDIGISVTITPYNVDLLLQIPDWLKSNGINNFGLNQLVCSTYKMTATTLSQKDYLEKSAKQIINSFVKTRAMGIYEDRMERKTRAFISNKFYPVDCGAYGQQIVIQPNGSVSICHADWEYNIGHVEYPNNPLVWETQLVKEWKKRLPIYNKKCLKCEAIGICGGGCAYCAKQCARSIYDLDKSFCQHTKTVLDFLIWDLYEQSKL